ncbi:hypothetical protein BDW42DRAFT_46206 [Aspergillus taichungensis]|uniref:Uncharacterized protein n=1 Tax=Aspergillus taichungensis TaxID=482145 RepID=A0A2J5I3F4_9EURO|nr:hypothetical protein BDW42DRAFT_46206 [Aspergillus taichungensis]
MAITVPRTDTTTLRNVTVLTWHPKGGVRSSHRSFCPRGQIPAFVRGARMGKWEGLGTQVDVWLFC